MIHFCSAIFECGTLKRVFYQYLQSFGQVYCNYLICHNIKCQLYFTGFIFKNDYFFDYFIEEKSAEIIKIPFLSKPLTATVDIGSISKRPRFVIRTLIFFHGLFLHTIEVFQNLKIFFNNFFTFFVNLI